MPLSNDLNDKNLMFQCQHCSETIVRKGSWIKSVRMFRCGRCQTEMRMTYGKKAAIFERHRHLAAKDFAQAIGRDAT